MRQYRNPLCFPDETYSLQWGYFFTGNKTGRLVADKPFKGFRHTVYYTVLQQISGVMRSGNDGAGGSLF